jgi:hypothetical protein
MKKFSEPKLIFNKFSVFEARKASENKLAFIYSSSSGVGGREKLSRLSFQPCLYMESAFQQANDGCGGAQMWGNAFSTCSLNLMTTERRVVRGANTRSSLPLYARIAQRDSGLLMHVG